MLKKKDNGLYSFDEETYPGVTTVINAFSNKSYLIKWAFNCGKEGKDIDEIKNRSIHIGTNVHSLIESYFKNDKKSLGNLLKQHSEDEEIMNAFESFRLFVSNEDVVCIASEVISVSPFYRFGGTIDFVGYVNGVPFVLDWKTSNQLNNDNIIQLAAYIFLLQNGVILNSDILKSKGNELLNSGGMLVKLSKDGKPSYEKKVLKKEWIPVFFDVFRFYLNAFYTMRNLKDQEIFIKEENE